MLAYRMAVRPPPTPQATVETVTLSVLALPPDFALNVFLHQFELVTWCVRLKPP